MKRRSFLGGILGLFGSRVLPAPATEGYDLSQVVPPVREEIFYIEPVDSPLLAFLEKCREDINYYTGLGRCGDWFPDSHQPAGACARGDTDDREASGLEVPIQLLRWLRLPAVDKCERASAWLSDRDDW